MKIDLELDKDFSWNSLKKYLLPEVDPERVNSAYLYALNHHLGQKRESGEDYMGHPFWIAKVVAQLELDENAIITALLHDCVEDTGATIEEISDLFGDEVGLLVAGLTEVSLKTKGLMIHNANIENFRRFLFSSVNDVRILIIRIVDKLHNGLTIEYLPKDRQINYANRVMGIYGPICEYVGLHSFKRILEDIAFKILYPKESSKLEKLINLRSDEEIRTQKTLVEEIEMMLKVNRVNNYEIQTRIKGLYSTFKKIKNGLYSKEVHYKDRVGIRVLTESVNDCYLVLGLIHAKYKYLDDEFNDYISTPKANGYRSIQTTFFWKNKIMVEVQIRTFQMHEFNEYGPASHIAYKMSKGVSGNMGLEWVKDLVRWQKEKSYSNYKISVLTENIYVFTPKGDVLQLPKDSTAIDFAYSLHSDLGDYCRGALVNDKMVKIDFKLKTGDMVKILVGKTKTSNAKWLEFVKSDNARSRLRKLRKKQEDWI